MAFINAGDWPIDPAQTTGNDLADLLNRLTAAIMSGNSGPSAPPDVTAGMVWTRANTNGTFDLRMFDGTANRTLLTVDASGSVNPAGTYTSSQIDNKLQALESSILSNTVPNVYGGNAINVTTSNGIKTVNHADTSSSTSVNNSGGTVLQSIGFDTYGHVISRGSVNLDNRYYTQSQANNRYVSNGGDTMSGSLTFSSGRILMNGGLGSQSSPLFDVGNNTGFYRGTGPDRLNLSVDGSFSFRFDKDGALNGSTSVLTRGAADDRYADRIPALGSVGSYAMLRITSSSVIVAPGSTRSGSVLAYAAASGRTDHPGNVAQQRPSGTWRCMGFASSYDGDSKYDSKTTLWLRIS